MVERRTAESAGGQRRRSHFGRHFGALRAASRKLYGHRDIRHGGSAVADLAELGVAPRSAAP